MINDNISSWRLFGYARPEQQKHLDELSLISNVTHAVSLYITCTQQRPDSCGHSNVFLLISMNYKVVFTRVCKACGI